tara:strand:- start:75 stop:305 length:231 start_codon:yes stop_codon:yes gene_type:complete
METLLLIKLRMISCVSLLIAITGLFQLRLSVSQEENPKVGEPAKAVFNYRYMKGGFLLLILSCLIQYFALMFSFKF